MLKKIFLALLLVAIVVPVFAFAQVKLNLSYPNFGPFNPATNQSLGAIIGYLYYLIVGIAGLAAFVMLIWGGVQWLVSGAIPSQASEARDKVRNAIIGLLLVLASFLIAQTINPALTIINMDFLSLGDRTSYGRWLFGGSNTPYRCEYVKGEDKFYKCEGTLPKGKPGSSGSGEQCVEIPGAYDPVGLCTVSCTAALGSDGEKAEVTVAGKKTMYCCYEKKLDTCRYDGKDYPLAQTIDSPPISLNYAVMKTRFGVYGCDDDGCLKAWRWFYSDTPDVENSPIMDSSPKGDTIEGQIGSLWINGPFIAVLYEHENYAGKRICFDARNQTLYPSPPGLLISRLDDYDGWGNETDSIRILQDGNSEIDTVCPYFQVTL
ncbi:MAG: hypothetical protein HYT49_01185 [Candidatus Wildermuthbacteria bacterium]|nr:hypothetical protein [Candidatus Wildermuthbacteria bacterium]